MNKPDRLSRPQDSPWLKVIHKLGGRGADPDTWLLGAEDSVGFLRAHIESEELVLYANTPHVYLHAVLVPLRRLRQCEAKDLAGQRINVSDTWLFNLERGYSPGGRERNRAYISPPLREWNSLLKGGEKLVFRRNRPRSGDSYTEMSQRLVHSLELHFIEESQSYCRVDELGDFDEVIRVVDEDLERDGDWVQLVTIRSRELFEYARLSGMGLVFFFDFNRFHRGSFQGWDKIQRFEREEPDLFYSGGVEPGVGSFIYGRHIVPPKVARREIVRRLKHQFDPQRGEYATFKVSDLKTGRRIEVSCDPAGLSNYFQPESNLPLEMSPAFFRGEVLAKYKADPAKYELEDRGIRCRDAWLLETYDVNEAGQVHTYLRYLSILPYQEQLYWQSFNEWQKAPLSKRAFTTDFEGEFSDHYDPIAEIRHKVKSLDKSSPDWWSPRGEDLARTLHYPISGSEAEWAEAILNLDQLVIEGFRASSLKKMLKQADVAFDPEWGSIKLLESYLAATCADDEDASHSAAALRAVHDLRNAAKGHSAPRKKVSAVKTAKEDYGDLNLHFRSVAARCDEALKFIVEELSQV